MCYPQIWVFFGRCKKVSDTVNVNVEPFDKQNLFKKKIRLCILFIITPLIGYEGLRKNSSGEEKHVYFWHIGRFALYLQYIRTCFYYLTIMKWHLTIQNKQFFNKNVQYFFLAEFIFLSITLQAQYNAKDIDSLEKGEKMYLMNDSAGIAETYLRISTIYVFCLASITEMEVKYEIEKKEMQIAAFKEEKRLMAWLSIAGGGVLLLGLAALFFLWRWTAQKHRLAESQIKQLEQEKQLVAAQAVFNGEVQERTRLARDLHDGLGGKLTCMKIGLQELKQSARFDGKEEKFQTVMDLLNDSVQEMRRVSHNLMPDTLSHSGLKQAVDDFCRSMSPLILFQYYGDESRLDMKLETLIYLSIYELVNNALKYAGASHIMVQILREADSIAFTVQDNGCGFDTTAETRGIGLRSILNRVTSFGGEIQIDSKMGEGTEVNVELRVVNYEL